MITTKFIRRHYIEKAVKAFSGEGKLLEVGSGEKWRCFPKSITLNRDSSASPDVIGDAENMDFPDAEFDGVVCLEVLEHTTSPQSLIAEIYRVLKPGGNMLMTVPFTFEIHDKYDYYRYTKEGLKFLLRDFGKVDIQSNGGKYSVISHFLRIGPFGEFVYPLLNNIGYFLDCLFKQKEPVVTLGYTVIAVK